MPCAESTHRFPCIEKSLISKPEQGASRRRNSILFPRKGHRNGIIVDDYGNEWLVQLTNGREVPVYKDEVFII